MASMDLKKSQVKPFFGFGNDLIVYRGTSGKVYVLDAYCPHLGANIGVGGTVVGEDIKCPFHGWTFNNEGKCVAVPGIEATNTPKAEIKIWETLEINGFIYVWNHLKGEKPYWFVDPIEDIVSKKFEFVGRQFVRTKVHIQDAVENSADNVHFPVVHFAAIMNNSKITQDNKTELIYRKSFLKMFMIQMNYIWYPSPKQYLTNNDIVIQLYLGSYNIFKVRVSAMLGVANVSAFLEHSGIILFRYYIGITHISPNELLIDFHYYRLRGSFLSYILTWLLILFGGGVIFDDVVIWDNKIHRNHPYLAKNEQSLRLYRKWYQQFYCEDKNTEIIE